MFEKIVEKTKFKIKRNRSVIMGIIAAVTILAALAFGISKGSESAANRSMAQMDQMLLDEINALREEKGLEPLAMDETLKALAATRSKEIASKWSHTRPDGSMGADMIPKDKWRGENLAFVSYPHFGYTDMEKENAIETEMDDLKSSKTHYDNMVCKDFTKIGIRTYVNETEDGITLYTAYLFSN